MPEVELSAARALARDLEQRGWHDVAEDERRRIAAALIAEGDVATVDVAGQTYEMAGPLALWALKKLESPRTLVAPVPVPLLWNARADRLFACECAARVLGLFEAAVPGDPRPREAVDVARRFALGEVDDAQRLAAADAAEVAWRATRDWDQPSDNQRARVTAARAALAAAEERPGELTAQWASSAVETAGEEAGADGGARALAEIDWQVERLLSWLLGQTQG